MTMKPPRSAKHSPSRLGWLSLVPPHPGPLPQGEGTGILRLLKSGVVLTGTVRSAIQLRDASTTQRVRFATQRRAILPLPKGFLLPTNDLRCLYLYINELCIL